jgi:hypothetical protein
LSDVDAAELIRQGREERDRELMERLGEDEPEPGSSSTPRWWSTS